jgi:predicted ATPase
VSIRPDAPIDSDRLHAGSHGEAFLALPTHKLRPKGWLLDKPEAALSVIPQRVQDESRFIIANHSTAPADR